MADSKRDNSYQKIRFDKAVFLYAYIFLLIPQALFLLFWTKLYIGIPACAAALAGFYFIVRQKREYKDFFGENYRKKIIAIAVLALIWTLLSGQGGLFFQNPDYNMRNAIYSDLVKYDWPVIFQIPSGIEEGLSEGTGSYQNAIYFGGKEATIVYYLGYWLPPAAAGKLFYNVFGNAGFAGAEAALVLWTFSAVFAVLYLFLRAFGKYSNIILAVFVFFSGMDILMSLFYYATGLQGLLFPEGRLIPHLETWTMQQYTSNTAALFWVFNQALPIWLFCCILLNEKDLKYIFFPYACLAITSTLPMAGALPLIFYFIISRFRNEREGAKITLKETVREALKYINLTNIAAIPLLLISCLYIISSPQRESFSFMSGYPTFMKLFIILGSLLIEIAFLILILFQANTGTKKGLLITVSVLLFIIPFFNLGQKYDFTMRVSLPALFFLCYLCCDALLFSDKKQIVRLLAIVLIIGSFTPLFEILQPVVYVFTGQNPRAAHVQTLADVTNYRFEAKNCLGTMESFFMKYILRR